MTASQGKRALRKRVASVVNRAVRAAGSRKLLAEYLGVPVTSVAQWLFATSDMPDSVLDQIIQLLSRL
jgi:DNA-binding transcriptional regulator YdaS (Cro superfamily)